MAGLDRVQKRFDELAEMGEELLGTKDAKTWTTGGKERWIGRDGDRTPIRTHKRESVDFELAVRWQTSVLSLLSQVLRENDPVLERYKESLDKGGYANSWSSVQNRYAIFLAVKESYEGGYLFDIRNLVHADVFSDELEQASHFLSQGYKVPAAVIAGTILETTLREMCDQHPNLAPSKADKMISDLAKEGQVNKMRADQLRAWMKTRNSAAHGKPDEFNDSDVTRMIDGIRDFVANHMS